VLYVCVCVCVYVPVYLSLTCVKGLEEVREGLVVGEDGGDYPRHLLKGFASASPQSSCGFCSVCVCVCVYVLVHLKDNSRYLHVCMCVCVSVCMYLPFAPSPCC